MLHGQKRFGFLVLVGFKIGALTLFFQPVKYVIGLHVYMYAVIGTRPNFPDTKYRGKESGENVHTPIWKSRLKHSTAEVQPIQQLLLQLDIVL